MVRGSYGNRTKHDISDKGVEANSHASICPTDPGNIAFWVKALAATGKMGHDWMWQVDGHPVAYWAAEDGIATPRQRQYAALQEYMNTWFTAAFYTNTTYRPKARWIADIEAELAPQGWSFAADAGCDLVATRQDGKAVHLFLKQTSFPADEAALAARVKACQAQGVKALTLMSAFRMYDPRTDGKIIAAAVEAKK